MGLPPVPDDLPPAPIPEPPALPDPPEAPSGPSLCGFALPAFPGLPGFRIPGIPGLDFPPSLFFALALRCDLSDPLDADFGFGGGRQPTGPDPDADPEFG